MKNGKILSKISILAILLIMSGSAFAQRSQRGQEGQNIQTEKGRMAMRDGKVRMGIQDGKSRLNTVLVLSEDQQEKLSSMRLDHQKDMRYQQNLLGEKNASLKTLLSAPERDKTAIDKTIDDISLMKGELMKKQIANRDEMKSIFSPEQVEKLESLGYWNSMRQGVRGKRTSGIRDGKRGGNGSPVGRRDFHGRGFGQPNN